jgi:hypothetical protein
MKKILIIRDYIPAEAKMQNPFPGSGPNVPKGHYIVAGGFNHRFPITPNSQPRRGDKKMKTKTTQNFPY